jgi:putative phosphoribosyl transferase
MIGIRSPRMATATPSIKPRPVQIVLRDAVLNADLAIPRAARGLVIFAHGSGSSRHSSRNQGVARELEQAGFATLLLDLLTEAEERIDITTAEFRFDIPLLGSRVSAAVAWARTDDIISSLPIGIFGASTGAAAALIAAADHSGSVRAVVSRGGRPDLAASALERVRAPCLLIVGERDDTVITLNQQALARLTAPAQLAIVPRATHLFEEPGTLARVVELAREWFDRHLVPE